MTLEQQEKIEEKASEVYKDKFKVKNINQVRHIIEDGSLSLPAKMWQTHLRNYRKTAIKTQKSDVDNNK